MPHVVVAGPLHEAGLEVLKSASGFTFTDASGPAADAYAAHMETADALLIRTQPLTAAMIGRAPKLRIVSRHGVGYDTVDVPALNARGIPLCIVGDVNSRAVAEHTLMLMLSVARRTVAFDTATRTGDWKRRNTFETTELDGKTLLLAGFGRIGRRVAELSKAFGMTVAAFDPFVPAEAFAKAGVAHVTDLAGALPSADFLSVHIPMSGGKALVGAEGLATMKPTAIVINTARGGLIEEAALDAALKSGRLAGAGMDVFVEEPPKADHTLLANPRVTLSPHSAGLTAECARRMAISSAQNIVDFFAGKLDRGLVVNAEKVGPGGLLQL